MTPQPWLGSQAGRIWDAQPPPRPHPPAQPSDRGGRGGPAGGTRPDNSLRQLHTQARTLWPEEGGGLVPQQQVQVHRGPFTGRTAGGGRWNTHTPTLHPELPNRGPVCPPSRAPPSWRPAPCSTHPASDATSALGAPRPHCWGLAFSPHLQHRPGSGLRAQGAEVSAQHILSGHVYSLFFPS